MFLTIKFSKKVAVCVVLGIALVLITLIIVFSMSSSAETMGNSSLKDTADRVSYLGELGYEVDPTSETYQKVLIPREFTDVFLRYNAIQKEQGFDLEQFSGLELDMYTYVVTNYDSKDTVIAVIFLNDGEVVGGDIHSTTLNGFMEGIKSKE